MWKTINGKRVNVGDTDTVSHRRRCSTCGNMQSAHENSQCENCGSKLHTKFDWAKHSALHGVAKTSTSASRKELGAIAHDERIKNKRAIKDKAKFEKFHGNTRIRI